MGCSVVYCGVGYCTLQKGEAPALFVGCFVNGEGRVGGAMEE